LRHPTHGNGDGAASRSAQCNEQRVALGRGADEKMNEPR
jgi:hypothetical protein